MYIIYVWFFRVKGIRYRCCNIGKGNFFFIRIVELLGCKCEVILGAFSGEFVENKLIGKKVEVVLEI